MRNLKAEINMLRLNGHFAVSSLNTFIGCLSRSKKSSPPGQKSVMRQTCVFVCRKHIQTLVSETKLYMRLNVCSVVELRMTQCSPKNWSLNLLFKRPK